MRIIKNVQSVYSYRDEDYNLKGGKYECMILHDEGYVSFSVEEFNRQLIIEEKFLKDALRKNESIEISGACLTLNFDTKETKSKECIIHINVMPLVTNLYIVDFDEAIGLSNFELKRILNCL
ncbi:hypothetical protein CNEO2_170012 [Clostridium neonatale]|uniref:hypothetical protein n=1 Tax=Clostridium neonatale TaxID=137838 RepID=UPI00291BB9D7|nr:hypothetical protein [Clostridium neonatale]CAI3223998.1 hypothetical protein CNEO2_170012 [Clostridium neonatale]